MVLESKYLEKENAPFAGRYEVIVKEGDTEAQIQTVRVIGREDTFKRNQLKSGSPIIAYRHGSHGGCSIILNLEVFSGIKEVVQYETTDKYYVTPGKTHPRVLDENQYNKEMTLFGDFLDNSPRLLINATTLSGLPFYASVIYIPTSFRHPQQPKL